MKNILLENNEKKVEKIILLENNEKYWKKIMKKKWRKLFY